MQSEEAQGTPAKPSPVALDAAEAPDDLAIGVVVSLTGEGSDWSEPAEGARVATYRYGLGERAVVLRPVDDKGTTKGATAAVGKLLDQGVSGIVMATEGDHVRAAVTKAAAAGVPVLLPYETDAAGLPDGAWLTGPDRGQVVSALAKALAAATSAAPWWSMPAAASRRASTPSRRTASAAAATPSGPPRGSRSRPGRAHGSTPSS